jgi:hypothetical protein
MRIRACGTFLKNFYDTALSGHADPGVQNRIKEIHDDAWIPDCGLGVTTAPIFFYDDARIQKCGSGHHTFLET